MGSSEILLWVIVSSQAWSIYVIWMLMKEMNDLRGDLAQYRLEALNNVLK